MIKIYTSPSCSSCRKVKKWFLEQNIPFIEKNIFVALSRQRGPQWANALITMCSNLEGAVRSFIEMVQREGDQLVGILLMGCDWWVVR